MEFPSALSRAILLILALLAASSVFSLFSFALAACRKHRIREETNFLYKSLLKALDGNKEPRPGCRLWIDILVISAAIITGISVTQYLQSVKMTLTAFPVVITAVSFLLCAVLLVVFIPKIISAAAPEKVAAFLLPLIKLADIPLKPFLLLESKFLDILKSSVDQEAGDSGITEDEIRNALIEGEKSGVVESSERTMVEGVFYLGDRPVSAFMTHRSEVQWLDCNAPYEQIRDTALEYRKQRCFPVVNGNPDEIVGAVYLEDIILDFAQPKPSGLRAVMKKAQFVSETISALKAFESFKQGEANFLFVIDEYGGLSGIISIRALVEEITGELTSSVKKEEPVIRQKDGSWLADGALNFDDAAKALSMTGISEDHDFNTLAGFILSLSGELPGAGDSVDYQNYRFTVKEMDGNRIDKLLVYKL
jgi:putative hemolysin